LYSLTDIQISTFSKFAYSVFNALDDVNMSELCRGAMNDGATRFYDIFGHIDVAHSDRVTDRHIRIAVD